MATEQGGTWTVDTEPRVYDIDEVDLHDFELRPVLKFVVAFLVGGVFFLLPVPYQGE